MRWNQRFWRFAAMGLIVLLANGCGRDEDLPDTSSPDRGSITLEGSPDAAAPAEPEASAAKPEASAAEKCVEMAAREDWNAALDPCTRAARDHPEDEAVQRALERAVGASEPAIE